MTETLPTSPLKNVATRRTSLLSFVALAVGAVLLALAIGLSDKPQVQRVAAVGAGQSGLSATANQLAAAASAAQLVTENGLLPADAAQATADDTTSAADSADSVEAIESAQSSDDSADDLSSTSPDTADEVESTTQVPQGQTVDLGAGAETAAAVVPAVPQQQSSDQQATDQQSGDQQSSDATTQQATTSIGAASTTGRSTEAAALGAATGQSTADESNQTADQSDESVEPAVVDALDTASGELTTETEVTTETQQSAAVVEPTQVPIGLGGAPIEGSFFTRPDEEAGATVTVNNVQIALNNDSTGTFSAQLAMTYEDGSSLSVNLQGPFTWSDATPQIQATVAGSYTSTTGDQGDAITTTSAEITITSLATGSGSLCTTKCLGFSF